MVSPDLAGVERSNRSLATVPCAKSTGFLAFFSFFLLSLVTTCQSPFSVEAWLLDASFPLLEVFMAFYGCWAFHPQHLSDLICTVCNMARVFKSINFFTSALCVEERVGIVGNGCTLGPKSYPSSLRPNLRLAGPGIHGQTGLARSNTGSDTCVQYALPDPFTKLLFASLKREPAYRVFSQIRRTHITVMRR